MQCPVCYETIEPSGDCACSIKDSSADTWAFAVCLGIVSMMAFSFAFSFWILPGLTLSSCKDTIYSQEKAFLSAFFDRVATSSNYTVIGWEKEYVAHWGLVTLLYLDDPDRPNRRKAYLWCVDTKSNTAHRLRSLSDFVDNYLLKED